MEFRRIKSLPPYVFTIINDLKIEARRAGTDIIDLGFGNPDLPSPDAAVDKLAEAVRNPRNHRYSSSRGLPRLREAMADLYRRRFGVELDPDTEVINTIGAKEGFSHLMWVLLQPGDTCLVPAPSYPIHIYGPLFDTPVHSTIMAIFNLQTTLQKLTLANSTSQITANYSIEQSIGFHTALLRT